MSKEDEKLFQALENNLDEIKDETAAGVKIEEKTDNAAIPIPTQAASDQGTVGSAQVQTVSQSTMPVQNDVQVVSGQGAVPASGNVQAVAGQGMLSGQAGVQNAPQSVVEAPEGASTSVDVMGGVAGNTAPETANNGQIVQNTVNAQVPIGQAETQTVTGQIGLEQSGINQVAPGSAQVTDDLTKVAADSSVKDTAKPKKSKKTMMILIIVLVVVILAGVGIGLWLAFDNRSHSAQGNTNNSSTSQGDSGEAGDNEDDDSDDPTSPDGPRRDKLVALDTKSDEVQAVYGWFGDISSTGILRFFEDELIGNKKDAVKLGRVEVALANTGMATCRASWTNGGLDLRYGAEADEWEANRKKIAEECRDAEAVQTKFREIFGYSLNLDRMELTADGMYFTVKGRYWDYSKDYNEFFNTLIGVDNRTEVIRKLTRAARDGNRLYVYEMAAAMTCEENHDATEGDGEEMTGGGDNENADKGNKEQVPLLQTCRVRRLGSSTDAAPLQIWNNVEEVPNTDEVLERVGSKVVVEYVFDKNSNGKYIFDSLSYIDGSENK